MKISKLDFEMCVRVKPLFKTKIIKRKQIQKYIKISFASVKCKGTEIFVM